MYELHYVFQILATTVKLTNGKQKSQVSTDLHYTRKSQELDTRRGWCYGIAGKIAAL